MQVNEGNIAPYCTGLFKHILHVAAVHTIRCTPFATHGSSNFPPLPFKILVKSVVTPPSGAPSDGRGWWCPKVPDRKKQVFVQSGTVLAND